MRLSNWVWVILEELRKEAYDALNGGGSQSSSDNGSITQASTNQLDYGLVTDPSTKTIDYGTI